MSDLLASLLQEATLRGALGTSILGFRKGGSGFCEEDEEENPHYDTLELHIDEVPLDSMARHS